MYLPLPQIKLKNYWSYKKRSGKDFDKSDSVIEIMQWI